MADAYKVNKDQILPRAVRAVGERVDGSTVYEKTGVLYPEGSYVLASDISPDVLERVEAGEFEGRLEEADLSEAQDYINALNGVPKGTFVPEHEVEAEALLDAGHKIVDREEKIKLRAADSDAVAEAQAEALSSGADERNVTIDTVVSTTEASEEGTTINPRRIGADDQYVTAEEAGQIQTDPSGVVAQMPSEDAPKRRAPRRRAAEESKSEGTE